MPIYRTAKRGVAYSQALAEAYASAPENEIVLDTLELRHSLFVDAGEPFAIRIVNDHSELTATLEDDTPLNGGEEVLFRPVHFTITRPSESEEGQSPEAEVTISNVSQYIVPYLDRLVGSRELMTATWRPYLASDLTGPHMNPPLTLTVRNIDSDMMTVVLRLGLGELTNRRFPAIEYTALKFPGMAAR
jgi:hypothetical protein